MNSQLLDVGLPRRKVASSWSERNDWRLLMMLLAVVDAVIVGASFSFAYALRFLSGWTIFQEGAIRPDFYLQFTLILVPLWIALHWVYGLYTPTNLFNGTQEYVRIFNAASLGILLVIVITFLQPDIVVARAWLLMAWFFILSGMVSGRFIMRRVVYAQWHNKRLLQRVVILGVNAESRAIVTQLREAENVGAEIVGFIDDHTPVGSEVVAGVRALGPVNAFEQIVNECGADSIIVADPSIVREQLVSMVGAIETMRRLDVCLATGIFDLLTIGFEVREQGSVPLLALNKNRITGLNALGKGLLDRIGALVGLILLSPILLLIALLVKLDSPGPIIHRRRVVGVGNQTFDAFKFRSMHVDGDAHLTPEMKEELEREGKLKDDPRVTRIGAFIRRASIDELPQLVNVLFGQMSLVGPRMIILDEMRHFGRWRHNLVTVRPGLTGLWQINGRSHLGYEERVRLDMHYIRNYSIWLDLYIIVRTISVVITGHGAF